jgi:hypothetical protein
VIFFLKAVNFLLLGQNIIAYFDVPTYPENYRRISNSYFEKSPNPGESHNKTYTNETKIFLAGAFPVICYFLASSWFCK